MSIDNDEVLHMYESANHLVAQATSQRSGRPGDMLEPDWETNMRICDMVNSSPRPDVLSMIIVKCIETTIRVHADNPRVMWFVLLLLETLVKNCGYHFHEAINNKEVMKRIEKLGGKRVFKPKKVFPRPTTAHGFMKARVQEKVLSLFQAWGPLHPGELPVYEEEVQKLKRKGVMFPVPKPEDTAPFEVFRPASSGSRSSSSSSTSRPSTSSSSSSTSSSRSPSSVPSSTRTKITDSEKKLIDEVENGLSLFESLVEANSASEIQQDDIARELSNDLAGKRPKVTEMIEKYVVESDDERLMSTLFGMLERLELVQLKYDVLLAGGDIKEIFEDGAKFREEDEDDWESEEESGDERSKQSDFGMGKLNINSNRQTRSTPQPVPTAQQQKDEILEWVLSNIPSAPSISPNRRQLSLPLQPEPAHIVPPPQTLSPQNPFSPSFIPQQPQQAFHTPTFQPPYNPASPSFQPQLQQPFTNFNQPPQYSIPTFQPLTQTQPQLHQPSFVQPPPQQLPFDPPMQTQAPQSPHPPTFQPNNWGYPPVQQQQNQFYKPQQPTQQPFDPRH